MKKFLSISLIASAVLMAQEVTIETLNNLPIVKQGNITVEKFQKLDGLYHVKGTPAAQPGQPSQPIEFFLTENFKQLVMGRVINTADASPVRFPIDINILKDKEAFSYGNGKTVLYVFTDPECPYCKKFEQTMSGLKDKYTFKVFLFPLSFHKNAIPMSKYILAGKNDKEKFDRLEEISNDSKKYEDFKMSVKENQELDKLVDTQLEVGKQAEISGTPTIMDVTGKLLNWSQL